MPSELPRSRRGKTVNSRPGGARRSEARCGFVRRSQQGPASHGESRKATSRRGVSRRSGHVEERDGGPSRSMALQDHVAARRGKVRPGKAVVSRSGYAGRYLDGHGKARNGGRGLVRRNIARRGESWFRRASRGPAVESCPLIASPREAREGESGRSRSVLTPLGWARRGWAGRIAARSGPVGHRTGSWGGGVLLPPLGHPPGEHTT